MPVLTGFAAGKVKGNCPFWGKLGHWMGQSGTQYFYYFIINDTWKRFTVMCFIVFF